MPSLDFCLDSQSSDTVDTVGGRLSRAHELSGASIEVLAARAGVREALIRLWECDRAEPAIAQLSALAAALRVSPMWLAAGIGEGPCEGDGDHSASPGKPVV